MNKTPTLRIVRDNATDTANTPDVLTSQKEPVGLQEESDIPFGPGSKPTRPTRHPDTPIITTRAEAPGVMLIFRDGQQIWDVDWKTWGEVELAQCPPLVAQVKLGLGGMRAKMTPGEAVDAIKGALKGNGLLTRRAELLLDGIPRDLDEFEGRRSNFKAYELSYWFSRWWKTLAAAI